MSISEIFSMMLLLDCSNPIVVHSMALKHGALIHQICISWNKSVRNISRLPYTTHTWILGPLLRQPHIHCQLQQRTLRFFVQYRITTILWFLLVRSVQVTMQIHHSVITLHILEKVTVLTFSLMYVLIKQIIHLPQLDNE